jgi:hypothetical protein
MSDDNKFVFSFGEYEISVFIKYTSDGCYATAYCPICGQDEKADDHSFGDEYAAGIAKGSIVSHMKLVHKITNDKE